MMNHDWSVDGEITLFIVAPWGSHWILDSLTRKRRINVLVIRLIKRQVRFSLISLSNYFLLQNKMIIVIKKKTQRIFAIPQSRFIRVYSNRSTYCHSLRSRPLRSIVSKIHPFALTSRIRIGFCTVSKSCFLIPGTFSFAEARKRTADSRKQQQRTLCTTR